MDSVAIPVMRYVWITIEKLDIGVLNEKNRSVLECHVALDTDALRRNSDRY